MAARTLDAAGAIEPAPPESFSSGLERRLGRSARLYFFSGLVLLLLALASAYEVQTSALQSWVLSHSASHFSYRLGLGPSPSIVFPRGGPADERRGYARLPAFERSLEAHGFNLARQIRFSPELARLALLGISPPYREPSVTGLAIRGDGGADLFREDTPHRVFESFDDVPPLVAEAAAFIENRRLMEPADPRNNPVIDWGRLASVGMRYAGHKLGLGLGVEGGSTLATQMEKYNHSPRGRTGSPVEKLRQMTAASLKVYIEGPDTRESRRQILLDYLNTIPLAAAPGHGEVLGLCDGLAAWFGLDPRDVMDALREPEPSPRKARALKHVMALLCAVRAPSTYLREDRRALETRVTMYTKLLQAAGAFDARLARQTVRVELEAPPVAAAVVRAEDAAPGGKGVRLVRSRLAQLLGVGSYDLDRLDLEADTTLDPELQRSVDRLLERLKDPAFLAANGLREYRLLDRGDPRRVVYSVLLVERTPRGNLVRVQTDTLERPFDLNDGMKLELGSTAKLRTLAHYLELVAGLHQELSGFGAGALRSRAAAARDPITRWAARTLSESPSMGLDAFLDGALARRYSANPWEVFFTGGGSHVFENFDPDDDHRILSVREGAVRSVNLVFIRLMRDLVAFHEARLPYDTADVLSNPESPVRRRFLREIAERETRESLERAAALLRGCPDEAISRLLRDPRSPRQLSILFFAWNPGASETRLASWLSGHGLAVPAEEAHRLFKAYGNPRLTLADHAYLLRADPLELWCAGELARHPDLGWNELLSRAAPARRAASEWLFRTASREAQDRRLRIRFEEDAFERITAAWRRLGFPFEKLVPSLATAIGSSSDRPAALAELAGIIASGGVDRQALLLTELHFGSGTPYETVFEAAPAPDERVMERPVALALRAVMRDVVERGTARRAANAFVLPGGTAVPVGGKTGSGDNCWKNVGRGGATISSHAVSRTSTFVFEVGDYHGVITASVFGREAERYKFTSALPVSILKLLAPHLTRRMSREAERDEPRPGPVTTPPIALDATGPADSLGPASLGMLRMPVLPARFGDVQ